jgi:hypothetical protein
MGFRSSKEFLGYRIVVKNLENIRDSTVSKPGNILAKKILNRTVEEISIV